MWLTGLSGAGKTTLALEVQRLLRPRAVQILDGDELRRNLSAGLGFSRADRDTHVTRVAYVAELLARHGVLVGWDRARFDEVTADIRTLTDGLGLADVRAVPVSALTGGNVVTAADETPWYDGDPLLTQLADLDVSGEEGARPFRFPVQLVIRPRTAEHPDYRGLAGRVASGSVAVGDKVVAVPSGARSVVVGLDTSTGPVDDAHAGASVTVRLRDELDVGRGETLAHADRSPAPTDQLAGVFWWLAEPSGRVGQNVLVKAGSAVIRAILTSVDEHWNVDTLTWEPADGAVSLNDLATATLRLAAPVVVDDYVDNRETGGFLVIDPASGATLAVGLVGNPLAGRPR